MTRCLRLILAILLAIVPASRLCAQGATSALVAEYVPGQTLASISVWPARLATSQAMQLAPLEVLTAAGLENVGIDPLKIERIDLLIGMPGMMGPQFGALIQSTEAFDLNDLSAEMLDGNGVVDENGFEYVRLRGPQELIVHAVDAKTAILGTKNFAKMMRRNADPNNDIASVLAAIQSRQDALALVSIASLRPLLAGFAEGVPLPRPIVGDLSTVIDATELLALRVQMSDEEKLQLVVSAKTPADAEKVEAAMANLLSFAHEQITSEMKSNTPQDSPTGAAMLAYIDRLGVEILGMLKPKRSDARLIYEVKDFQDASVIGSLTAMLLPAIQASRVAAGRAQSANNLKQLGLALHNFESAYKTFPATAGLDDEGEPMVSWRVAVLPFLGENALFNEFNLEEPWDSEHNLALLERMPDVYRHPKRETKPGHTVYQALVGEETLLRLKEPTRLRDVMDGLRNTAMLVETQAERAIPWTAPQDYEVNMDDPSAGLFVDGFCAFLFGDGRVQRLPDTIDLEILKAIFTRAGAEVVRLPD